MTFVLESSRQPPALESYVLESQLWCAQPKDPYKYHGLYMHLFCDFEDTSIEHGLLCQVTVQ